MAARLFALSLLGMSFALAQAPSDAEIRKILADRIDRDHKGVGMVVGIIDPQGRRVVAYGARDKGDTKPLDGNTVFEIGSMTKVFTSLVLMDMVQTGEVALTDPVAKFLPASVKVPERNGHKITLADLSTQSSGLPRMPFNFKPKDPQNPYADYTVDNMYEFLSSYALPRDIGEKYEYSNLGVGLLGHALALRAHMDYQTLVRTRICEPLNMTSTWITLSPDMQARLAPGHDADLKKVSNWDLPTFAGAGALRSTANDMLTFLAANLGYTKTPLAEAMAQEYSIRKPTGVAGLEISYGWHVLTRDGKVSIWHNGGTGGYRTFMGFDPATKVGVVVLSNASTAEGPDDIGLHLIHASAPLMTIAAPKEHKQAPVDVKIFDGYVGRYEMAPNFILSVTRDSDQLFAQATGQGRFEIFPASDKEFFAKIAEIQFTFTTDASGKATSVVVHQGGNDTVSKRIAGEPERPKDRKAVAIDPKTVAAIVGQYQVVSGVTMTMTLDDGHLFTQITGQPKFEVFAENAHDYFLKIVDAQLTFHDGQNGKATEVVLHQGGRDTVCKRIEN